MSVSPISNIVRQAISRDVYTILSAATHERCESQLAKTGHSFYVIFANGLKRWVEDYAPKPPNYTFLDDSLGDNQIPLWLDLDIILSQSRFGQFQVFRSLANQLHVPLVMVEHTLPFPGWTREKWEDCRSMRGHVNVFISEYSVKAWGFDLKDPTVKVIEHALDSDMFKPLGLKRENKILSVVNDWRNRDVFCGYYIWEKTINGLPFTVVGDNPGLSVRAKSVEDLVEKYNQHTIFYNTSTISPIPTSLLESMACGCCPISTATCMIPDVITNGVNGFISNDEKELRGYLEFCLANPEKVAEMGHNARQTIIDRFSPERYIREWREVFDVAANTPFTGI